MRMPRTTMNVTSASQARPISAINLGSLAAVELICAGHTELSRNRVVTPAKTGAVAQKKTLATI